MRQSAKCKVSQTGFTTATTSTRTAHPPAMPSTLPRSPSPPSPPPFVPDHAQLARLRCDVRLAASSQFIHLFKQHVQLDCDIDVSPLDSPEPSPRLGQHFVACPRQAAPPSPLNSPPSLPSAVLTGP